MFLLVRDEDGPTVAAAINAFADEEGLEPIDLEEGAQNPLAVLSVLTGPRAIVTQGEDAVAVFGLESLDVADAEDWGSAISAACETEVLALEVADDGVRVHVYDNGEPDEVIDVHLDPSGRTRAPMLADLSDVEEGQRALTEGIAAANAVELAVGILRSFGVEEPGEDALMLSFVDPLDGDDEADATPRLDVQPLAGAPSAGGFTQMFAVTLRGGEEIDGLRLEVSGSALDLGSVEPLEVAYRTRDAHERASREVALEGGAALLADAHLERIDAAPPQLDLSDMFATMQRLVSAGDDQQRNTLLASVRLTRKRAGKGALTLKVFAPSGDVAEGEATVVVEMG